MQRVLARLVAATHTLVVVFVVIAWALPWTSTLWAAVVVYPLVQINWWVLNGRCVLTVLEERLAVPGPGDVREGEEPRQLNFTARLCSHLLRRPVSHRVADALGYALVWGGLVISSIRLYLRETA